MAMSDEELEQWCRHGSQVSEDSVLLGNGYGADIIKLWNVIGALGEKVRDLESKP